MRRELLELAERCEQATGLDLSIDGAIAQAVGARHYSLTALDPVTLCYTASIDAAMTLVPEGWVFVRLQQERSWRNDPRGDVMLMVAEMMEPRGEGYAKSYALTPALALCAAALRARAALNDERAGGEPK